MAELDLIDGSERIEHVRRIAGEFFVEVNGSPDISKTLSALESEMRHAAKAMQFERAAELRDRMKQIKLLNLGL